MKMRTATRLVALILTMAMLMVMIPAAFAAGNAAISAANDLNNFDYEYGSVVSVDAGAEGAVFTKTFDRPANAKSGAVYAAIVPQGGSASDVRYVRLSGASQLTLTYFRTGYRHFDVQLVQPLPDAGDGALYVTKTGEELSCMATLDMSRAMAQIVDTYKNQSEMDRITYVCHLRTNTDLVEFDVSSMELTSDIFEVVSIRESSDGYGYDVTCELRPDWKKTTGWSTLVEKLMKTMTFTAEATLTAADEAALAAEGISDLYATGWITVDKIPAKHTATGTTFQVPMTTVSLALAGGKKPLADPSVTGVAQWLETEEHLAFMNGYPDGSFCPNLPIKRAEVAQMFYNLLLNKDVEITASFDDVPQSKWYYTAVSTLASMGILTGDGAGSFFPERSITRAEFATIAARFGIAAAGSSSFTDVPPSHWAYSYITTAAAYGWVDGRGNNMFMPQQNITRAEAATLVNRMLGRVPDTAALNSGAGRTFTDVTKAHWAWAQIGEASTEHAYTKTGAAEIWEK